MNSLVMGPRRGFRDGLYRSDHRGLTHRLREWTRVVNGRELFFAVVEWIDGEVAWQVTTTATPVRRDEWIHDIRFDEVAGRDY